MKPSVEVDSLKNDFGDLANVHLELFFSFSRDAMAWRWTSDTARDHDAHIPLEETDIRECRCFQLADPGNYLRPIDTDRRYSPPFDNCK